MPTTRRGFLAAGAAALSGAAFAADPKPRFALSLAQWSCHRMLKAKQLDPLDFPKYSKQQCGIDAVEYVNQFFMDKADDQPFIAELKKRCAGEGVTSVLIMIDREGNLGDPDAARRTKAVESHHQWVRFAKAMGCHSIRVNAGSKGPRDEQHKLSVDGLSRLGEFGAKHEINVIVENHGGLSSDGSWLAGVIKACGHPRIGTLPDFGNFNLGDGKSYDKYKGVEELMPFAKGVSAKSYDFDAAGNEVGIDFRRMLKIVAASGYQGRLGIEYEGAKLGELEGILATKKLIEKVLAELT